MKYITKLAITILSITSLIVMQTPDYAAHRFSGGGDGGGGGGSFHHFSTFHTETFHHFAAPHFNNTFIHTNTLVHNNALVHTNALHVTTATPSIVAHPGLTMAPHAGIPDPAVAHFNAHNISNFSHNQWHWNNAHWANGNHWNNWNNWNNGGWNNWNNWNPWWGYGFALPFLFYSNYGYGPYCGGVFPFFAFNCPYYGYGPYPYYGGDYDDDYYDYDDYGPSSYNDELSTPALPAYDDSGIAQSEQNVLNPGPGMDQGSDQNATDNTDNSATTPNSAPSNATQPTGSQSWTAAKNGEFPADAVVNGTENGTTTYYCRAAFSGSTYYGVLVPKDGCYVQQNSATMRFTNYDVMIQTASQ